MVRKKTNYSKYIFVGIILLFIIGRVIDYVQTELDKQKYRSEVNQVSLFVDSLENNITYGSLDVSLEELQKLTNGDSELEKAKKMVNELGEKYPDDYDYSISELENRVSDVEQEINDEIEKTKKEQEEYNREIERRAEEKRREEEAKREEENAANSKVDLEAYYNSIQTAIDSANSQAGMVVIDGMQKSSVTPGIDIYLGYSVASYSTTEIQAIISTLNQSLVNIAYSQGVNSPRFYYYLNGQEVAVNRYIMAPDEVKFTGILND